MTMHRVVAFQSAPGLCPYKDFPAFFEYLAALVSISFIRCFCILNVRRPMAYAAAMQSSPSSDHRPTVQPFPVPVVRIGVCH